MDKATKASEKVRPILLAMEQSVESARRRRLQGTGPADRPGAFLPTTIPAPMPNGQPALRVAGSLVPQPAVANDLVNGVVNGVPPRPKARPKRTMLPQ